MSLAASVAGRRVARRGAAQRSQHLDREKFLTQDSHRQDSASPDAARETADAADPPLSAPDGRFHPDSTSNRRRMREQRSLSPQQINVSESLR